MKLICLAVGKRHDAAIAAAIDDYTARLVRTTPLTWQLIDPAKGKMSQDETKRVESAALAAQLQNDDEVVLLDEGGVELSSRRLAGIWDAAEMRTTKRLVFVIGGAYGVSDQLKQRADMIWSLSKLTFPHQLVRLIVAEQLYRASTIRRGEPYHHQ